MPYIPPEINLYYDKIVDGWPIPNGSFSHDFTDDLMRIPFSKDEHSPIKKFNEFYHVMIALGLKPNLYSGKETTNNLFYPLELGHNMTWDRDLNEIISEKVKSKIKKGKMRLLVLVPHLSHDFNNIGRLKFRLDSLRDIPKEFIYIVLGDLNKSYKNLLGYKNLFGIDWNQIRAQIIFKNRYGLSSFNWVFQTYLKPSDINENLKREWYEIDEWRPKKIYTALSASNRLHNTSLISQLIYESLDSFGQYSFNTDVHPVDHDALDFRITRLDSTEEVKQKKIEIVNSLKNTIKILDFKYTDLKADPFKFKKELFTDSLINIVSQSWSPMLDRNYLDETNLISPGLGIWREIAFGHPFISLGSLNTMGYVTNEGYFSSIQLFSENYDKMSSTVKRISEICEIIKNLSELSNKEILEKVDEIKPFMEKNRKKFLSKRNQLKIEKLFIDMIKA